MLIARALSIIGIALLFVVGGAAGSAIAADAAPAKKKASLGKCPAGATPIITKRGRKLVAKRNSRGKLACKAIKRSAMPKPAASPESQIGKVADMLGSLTDLNSKSFAKVEKALGRRRASGLLDLSLKSWRQTAGASSVFQARGAVSSTQSFTSGGAEGSVSFGVEPVEGAQSGFNATASAELKVSRADVEKVFPAAKENLPADITGASAKVEVQFSDTAQPCPNDKGKVEGKLHGKGDITLTIERSGAPPIEVKLGAEITTTYTAQTGADGKVSAINNVEVQTTFHTGGSGQSTQTYRGRRSGTGFGTASILDAPAGKSAAAFERDVGHVDWNSGGDFGPRGGWPNSRPLEFSDLKSIDNVKAMIATRTATNLLTLAALEYVRKVAMDRIEKGGCGYKLFFDISTVGNFGTHRAEGKFKPTVSTRPVPGSATRWSGTTQASYTDVTFDSKIPPCIYNAIINTAGTVTVELELMPSGSLKVKWSAGPTTTASVDCPPADDYDPPPIPGQPGPSMLEAMPTEFEVPATGGLVQISGGVSDGATDGFFHSGTLLVSASK